MVQLFLNLTNMALSAFFVLELGMTSDGVGLAALIAELSAVLLALALALGMLRRHGRALLHGPHPRPRPAVEDHAR